MSIIYMLVLNYKGQDGLINVKGGLGGKSFPYFRNNGILFSVT